MVRANDYIMCLPSLTAPLLESIDITQPGWTLQQTVIWPKVSGNSARGTNHSRHLS